MLSFFNNLFEYNDHCNQKLTELFLKSGNSVPDKTQQLFHHILNAHRIWNHRINPAFPSVGVWETGILENCSEINRENTDATVFILKNFDLNQAISYSNTKGKHYCNSVRDILFHIINHSTYHRGQIASDLRQHGIDPPVTDYIFYKRS